MQDRAHLPTEQRLLDSSNLDEMPLLHAIDLMHRQDLAAVAAVASQRNEIAAAVEIFASALLAGGRVFYFGAGTSGRLGVLDASELPPTFRIDPSLVQGVVAGGDGAMFRAVEGAEDRADDGAALVDARQIGPNDVVFGIAAGGTTPFVQGALRRAIERNARTIFLSCVPRVEGEPSVDVVIRPVTGPEVITGSTRLKAGTATKLVLNTVSTLAMVRLGKVHGNLMVDLRASNEKLRDRATRIVSTITNTTREEAINLLTRADCDVKVAVVMHVRNVDAAQAREIMGNSAGVLRTAMRAT